MQTSAFRVRYAQRLALYSFSGAGNKRISRCTGVFSNEKTDRMDASDAAVAMNYFRYSPAPSAHRRGVIRQVGSGVFAMVAAFSVITVPAGAVTFTVNRTVHVVFGAMTLFSWQTIGPVPR